MIKNKHFFILILLIIFHILINLLWLKIDITPPNWDEATYLEKSIRYDTLLQGFKLENIKKIIDDSQWHPPFVELVTVFFYRIFGVSMDCGVLSIGIVFFPILIFSIYGIGKMIANPFVGLLAAFITTMYPFVYSLSRHYFLDFPLMAMVTAVIYFILKAKERGGWHNYIISMVLLAISMLIKRTAIIFIMPILFYLILKSKNKKYLAYSLFLPLLIIPWYGMAFFLSLKNSLLWMNQLSCFLENSGRLYYIRVLFFTQATIPYFIIFICSLIIFLKERNVKYKWLVIMWLLVPYVFFTWLPLKNERYTVSILPAIAIITAVGIDFIKQKRIKRAFTAGLVLYSLIQFIFQSTGITKVIFDAMQQNRHINNNVALYFRGFVYGFSPFPQREDWKINEAVRAIDKESKPMALNEPVRVVLIGTSPYWNKYTLDYYGIFEKLNFVYIEAVFDNDPEAVLAEDDNKFIVFKTQNNSISSITSLKAILCSEWLDKNRDRVSLIYNAKLPDNSHLEVYKRNL